jgi:prophage antirepressor-like protein
MLFKFKENPVRVNDSGKIWFCASDVCNALGYTNASKAIIAHCSAKGITKWNTLTDGGNQELTFIDEPNLYRLTIKSKAKNAVEFQDWIVEDVLPQIRQNGQYTPATKTYSIEELIIVQAQSMIEAKKRIEAVEERVKEIEAKTATSPQDFYTIAGYGSLNQIKVDTTLASKLGKKASALCKQMGYITGVIPDPRFGTVKTYHKDVLESIFNEYKKNL